jgi:uncharacterized MAPEG superfamily protein
LLILVGGIGVYRWSRILTGRASISEWRADIPQGSDWYQRSMRAHMNCVENLPIYTAVVMALLATDTASSTNDRLALAVLTARVCQSSIHILLPQKDTAVSIRFTFLSIQIACIIAIGVIVVVGVM